MEEGHNFRDAWSVLPKRWQNQVFVFILFIMCFAFSFKICQFCTKKKFWHTSFGRYVRESVLNTLKGAIPTM